MRMSRTFIPTLREDPAEAELVSHKLLLRAGYIRKLTAGIYIYLPLMQRVLAKISRIVREEMDKAGAFEITMPVLHPAELWQKTGRYNDLGPELMRLHDRHDRPMVLGGTHEEVVTELVKGELRSYRKLPLNLYQIQVKFRDEIRPRFGLMRGREFIMKDAYSFDFDEAGLDLSYQKMVDAYQAAFARCGLDTVMVESDTGAMGGKSAHEFMVIVDTEGGEATILSCPDCDYAANLERAESLPKEQPKSSSEAPRPRSAVDTPNAKTIEEVTDFLNVKANRLVKTLLYRSGDQLIAALIRGDRQINETKLAHAAGGPTVEMLDGPTVEKLTGAPVGFAGPVGLGREVTVIADEEVAVMVNFIVGANARDKHLVDVNLSDFRIDKTAVIRGAEPAERCPRCRKGRLVSRRGIEVGNTFKLGTKYSQALGATVTDDAGNERPIIMGSYGIGITRTAQAAVERFHDERGIIWPGPIAPADCHLVCANSDDAALARAADQVYESLTQAGLFVLYDDRVERAGVKFADADLIGIPWRVTVGAKGLAKGTWEIKRRDRDAAESAPFDQLVDRLKQEMWP
ncbi:MAG: proline--tRNA ligase [candidate division Zixibacteria bacterium]|nr:proline--tRNA ligase [candidate division Zixibacteria bacterium]